MPGAIPTGAESDGYWAVAQAIGVIPVYNKKTLPAGLTLTSWRDLLRPEMTDRKLAIQNAAAGTQFNWNYLLEQTLGPDFTAKFAAQRPVVMATGAQLTDAVICGDVLIAAALDHSRAAAVRAAGRSMSSIWSTDLRRRAGPDAPEDYCIGRTSSSSTSSATCHSPRPADSCCSI